MYTRPRRLTAIAFSAVLALFVACSDNEPGVTDPATDTEAPVLVITAIPDAIVASEQVIVEFIVTDEVELEQVVVSWGTPDTPSDIVEIAGRSYSGTCTHNYDVSGQFSIVVQVTDAAGHMTSHTHLITVTQPVPSSPTAVAANVVGNQVTISWTPGSWSTHQEVVVTRSDGLEPDRVTIFVDGIQTSALFSDLTWGATYEAVVAGINSVGRAESTPVAFQVPPPDPPILTRFSAVAGDPTCLRVEWTAEGVGAGSIENFRLAVTGDAEGDSFEEYLPATAREVVLCSDMYPIVDGMTYTTRVFALIEGDEYASNSLEFTVEFDPDYTAGGVWKGNWLNTFGIPSEIALDLVDTEGVISGSFAMSNQSGPVGSGPVTGTRTFGELDLNLDTDTWSARLTGLFAGPETIEAMLDLGLAIESVILIRQ